jgi:hypothetical protein
MSTEAEHKVDRSGWRPGPWDQEPDKLNWKTEVGLDGMIVRNGMGALCGYVAVPNGHPLYGVGYSDGDYPDSPEGRFDVHGGLTYSARCAGHICHVPEPGEPDDVWWFGFDCNHSQDFAPSETNYRSALRYADFAGYGGAYRDIAYVRAEVESLARQIAGVPMKGTER